MDFGDNFIKWIILIYVTQTVQIRVGGSFSKPCKIQRVTTQGFPLFPSQFISILEILNGD